MRIVVATDSFKGTLTSRQAGDAIAAGIHRVHPDDQVIVVPVADGGDGTADALLAALGGRSITSTVPGPLMTPVNAAFAILPDANRAVIEMAAASGLTLLAPKNYGPLRTTTYGTGRLITAALSEGCRSIMVGVGGSATVDGGCGAAQALGVRFLTADGHPLPDGLGGGQLDRIERVDLTNRDPRIDECEIQVLCDVNNPLCGSNGAARVFGPQKGAGQPDVDVLDRNLAHLADVIRRDLDIDVADVPGAGAAGGLAAGLMAFLDARLVPGVDVILDLVGLIDRLPGADLVVTGEGRLDAQSMMGKVVSGVAARAARLRIPTIAIAGCLGHDADQCLDILEAVYPVTESPPDKLPSTAEATRALTDRTAKVFAQRPHP
ncbi:MAG TPA: glycerate kinase [Phycisphaerae bacterium]|nr:glycerate kinase [Phycisphaerae bacterium]